MGRSFDHFIGKRYISTKGPVRISEKACHDLQSAVGIERVPQRAVPFTMAFIILFPLVECALNDAQVQLEQVVHGAQQINYIRNLEVGEFVHTEIIIKEVESLEGRHYFYLAGALVDMSGRVVCETLSVVVYRELD